MTAITIDKDKAIELLEKQVAKKGEDYVYEYSECEYFAGRERVRLYASDAYAEVGEATPLCILGHVYADLGLGPGDLRMECVGYNEYDEPTNEVHYEPVDNGALIGDDTVPDPEKVILTEDARLIFGTAQSSQDGRETWGRALADAKEAVQ